MTRRRRRSRQLSERTGWRVARRHPWPLSTLPLYSIPGYTPVRAGHNHLSRGDSAPEPRETTIVRSTQCPPVAGRLRESGRTAPWARSSGLRPLAARWRVFGLVLLGSALLLNGCVVSDPFPLPPVPEAGEQGGQQEGPGTTPDEPTDEGANGGSDGAAAVWVDLARAVSPTRTSLPRGPTRTSPRRSSHPRRSCTR
jgi:hypothetical protein